jgi:hypothetical protein
VRDPAPVRGIDLATASPEADIKRIEIGYANDVRKLAKPDQKSGEAEGHRGGGREPTGPPMTLALVGKNDVTY